jgi:polysaccharide deacetylase 2 family uncharacterized protein YibQ
MAAGSISGETARPDMRALGLAYAGAAAILILLAIAIAAFGNPHAGYPSAEIALKTSKPQHIARANPTPAPVQAGSENSQSPPETTEQTGPPPEPGVAPPSAVATTTVPANIVPSTVAKPVFAGRALVADPALIEATTEGPLPRIADNGRVPMEAYAAAAPAAGHPKIALVVAGLGFSARETAAALAQLPPAVTLAFAPYSNDVQRWVAEARRQGHEVLVEVPMEPYDFPDSDPGPHTLRAGVDEEANTQRLVWALTRFTGYTGVTNLLGSRFMADQDSLSPVMTFLARRGLLFYDNGSVSRSLAPQVARRAGTAFAQSAVNIDRIQTAMEIDRRLSDLETRARASGAAGGTGFVYPVTLERVSLWAQGLQGRGFVLVPASAIVARPN